MTQLIAALWITDPCQTTLDVDLPKQIFVAPLPSYTEGEEN
jgi:hypothetical protein